MLLLLLLPPPPAMRLLLSTARRDDTGWASLHRQRLARATAESSSTESAGAGVMVHREFGWFNTRRTWSDISSTLCRAGSRTYIPAYSMWPRATAVVLTMGSSISSHLWPQLVTAQSIAGIGIDSEDMTM